MENIKRNINVKWTKIKQRTPNPNLATVECSCMYEIEVSYQSFVHLIMFMAENPSHIKSSNPQAQL